MRPLLVGVVTAYDPNKETLDIQELQTGIVRTAPYRAGRAVSSQKPDAGSIRLSPTHTQGLGCALKRPEIGDAVCFELEAEGSEVARWGYLNRVLLATERMHPSRFAPRLVA